MVNARPNRCIGPSFLIPRASSASLLVRDADRDEVAGEDGVDGSCGIVRLAPARLVNHRMVIPATLIKVKRPKMADVVYQNRNPSG
jgi:hypothetical protein